MSWGILYFAFAVFMIPMRAEIADRLVLSVRTVDTHPYRAMHELGVSDRRAPRERPTR